MKTSKNFGVICQVLGVMLVLCCVAAAQKSGSAKTDVTGRYEGTAKNKANDLIQVTLELTEKDGALSGTIRSSQGDFPITSGSHHGDAVKLEFDAGGSPGMISLKLTGDHWAGTWDAGDDGGSVEVTKTVADGPKGK